MTAPTATHNKVRYRLMDTAATNPNVPDSTVLEEAITQAITKYSKDRPREVVTDVTGLTSPFIVVVGTGTVLSSWLDKFSKVLHIEYPAEAVTTDYVPTYLIEGDDYEDGYQDSSKTYIRLKSVTPQASDTFRIKYTTRHTHTDVSDTVPAGDLDALCDLAAHFACKAMATKYAASSDPLMKADSVNHRDGQLKFKQQADEWLAAYNDKMGIDMSQAGKGGPPAASAVADWDQTYQTGLPFLTHWGRRR